jgi:hypothetical protein
MHPQANDFIEAVKKNAAECWDQPDDKEFIDKLLYVNELANGTVVISDNFERFFQTIYMVDVNGNWYTTPMFGDICKKPTTFQSVMSDASIMYTG